MGNMLARSRRGLQRQTLAELAIVALIIYKADLPARLPLLARLNERLRAVAPWKIVLACGAAFHALSNASLLLGLNAPHNSLYTEPDMHYSPDFARIRYLLTALDAGVLSTLRVRPTFLRHVLSLLLGAYYLVFSSAAENKVTAFRKAQTIEAIRATWEKGHHPVFRAVARLRLPHIAVFGERVAVARPGGDDLSLVDCSLYYDKPRDQLKNERCMVLQFPGGGFVAMSPEHHEDYVAVWAQRLRVPVLAVNYRKAPEYPFPAGFNDCFDVFCALRRGNGSLLGIESSDAPIRIVVVGDSAGGNLAAAVALKAIARASPQLRPPDGVHLIYPALAFDGAFWKDSAPAPVSSADGAARAPPVMASKAKFAFDGVLPLQYMLKISEAYLREGGDPRNDYTVSPLYAPPDLLAQFPPVRVHVGAVDPLVDESIAFVRRLHEVNPNRRGDELRLWPGMSHAYMHVSTLLPAARDAVMLSAQWMAELLELEERGDGERARQGSREVALPAAPATPATPATPAAPLVSRL